MGDLDGWDGQSVWQAFDELAKHVVHTEQVSPHPLSGIHQGRAGAAIPQTDDFNESQEGLGLYRVNMRRGKRWTGVDAFLRGSGAEVRTNCEVSHLEMEGNRATAAILKNGERIAAKRIILSAGPSTARASCLPVALPARAGREFAGSSRRRPGLSI